MKVRLSLAAALLLACPIVFAQHDHQAPPASDPATEAMIKAGTPGDPHKALEEFVGAWTVKSSMWGAPGAPPIASEATSETKWIRGGRYLEEKFSGNFFGMPFEGSGLTGYDNVMKRY